MRYYYTDKEKEQLIKSIVIIVDTREKNNSHLLNWFDKHHINHINKSLKSGDYSFYINKNPELGINMPIYFDNDIMIERKASLDELSANLAQNRDRFEKEFAIYTGNKYLLIENSSYKDIVIHEYTTQFSPKSYLASLHTFNHRYNIQVMFMQDKRYSAMWIYMTFVYFIKNLIR